MTKPVSITFKNWDKLLDRLLTDYSKSTVMIREKRKKVLGFLERHHHWYDEKNQTYQRKIYLDFFEEKKKTMFLLKYGEFLEKDL